MPRLLTLMGSGETAPTMAGVHRDLLERLGSEVSGVVIDSPYAFQENAAEITARTVEWFARSIGVEMGVASVRGPGQDAVERAEALAHLGEAAYVFSGPGSPSHALRMWGGTEVPAILAAKLARGGAITFASAAALTVGAWTVPVYEVYKVGQEPRWLPGLDLLGPRGLPVAVIPHYDNAEGGTHDTRFCYLGERRLRSLEAELPAGHFVLGVDQHTALVLDLGAGTASVTGRGAVTVRVAGRSRVLPAGSSIPIDDLPRMAADLAAERAAPRRVDRPTPGPATRDGSAERGREIDAPLQEDVRAGEARFSAALASGDRAAAARAILVLEDRISAWTADTDASERERARETLRSLVVRLASPGRREAGAEPADLPASLVELLVELRSRARDAHDWGLSDRIRDALAGSGIELRDTSDGTDWLVRPPAA